MLRVACGLALVGLLVAGCGEQQAAEPTSRAEDRTAKLDQQQMISEDAGTLSAKSAPVSAAQLPTCGELGAALGERVGDWRLVAELTPQDLADGDAAIASEGEAGSDAAQASGLIDGEVLVTDDGVRRCEWHARPASESPHGLVIAVERADGQVRRTEVAGHVLDLPTVERAGGFVVASTRDPDLDAPLDADGASVVVGRTTVHIAAARVGGVPADAHLDLAGAIAAALELQQVVGH